MSRHRFAIVFLGALAVLPLLALPAAAGMYYEAKTTVEGGGPGSSQIKAWVDGESSRIEFVDSAIPTIQEGGYMVTEDGGRTLFLVNPEDQTFARYDLAAMMNVLEQTGGMVQMEFGEPEVEILEEKDGPEILGHATRYVRSRTAFDMTMKILGMTRTMSTESRQEMWVAADLDQQKGFMAWLRKGGQSSGNSGLDKLMAAELDKIQGVPLKSIVVSTTTGQGGSPQEVRTVTEVTKLEEDTAIDPTMFRIPAGYREISMMESVGAGEGGENPLAGIFGGG